ncbi:ribonuclease HIII [bacterium]|nr:ribonuclease HIII [bacterium]
MQKKKYVVNPYRDINFGLQFLVFKDSTSDLIRMYHGKRGTRIDFSQIKNQRFLLQLQTDLAELLDTPAPQEPLFDPNEKDVEALGASAKDPDDLIGIDESGKGDYFGPLVVAAVRIDPDTKQKLSGLGIQDSKSMTPAQIKKCATAITKHCQHVVLIMGNNSYNTVYARYKNLNHMLAWAHMKVLEDALSQGYCPNVLCDQFGNANLLKQSLRAKQLNVTLYQRPRAENNLAVACASVLARNSFVEQLDKMSKHYEVTFPKGASKAVTDTATKFLKTRGEDELFNVAKLHFKTTEHIRAKVNNKLD